MFSSEWEGLVTGVYQQHKGPVLPGAILYYVDGIFICSPCRKGSNQNAIRILNFLISQGNQASQNMTQITQQKVQYLECFDIAARQ